MKVLRWWIIGLICLGTIINYLARNSPAVLAPQLQTKLNFTTQQNSYIVGAFQIGHTVMQSVCGFVLDFLGLRLGLSLIGAAWSQQRGSHRLFGIQFSNCFLLAQESKRYAASVKIAPLPSVITFSEKGRTAFAKVVLIRFILDEAASLVCHQQISMLGFPAQFFDRRLQKFDRLLRVTHNSLKRHQIAVLAPLAAHSAFRPTLIRISFQDSDPAVAVFP
jgi:hypothetical protein